MRGHQPGGMRAGLVLGLLLSAALATPAVAQDYSYTASYNAGAVFFGKWNGSGSGTFAMQPSAGWVVGLQAEKWLGSGQLGLRFNSAYTKRPLSLPEGRNRNLAIGLGDVGLVLRLLPVTTGTPAIMPYLSASGGFVYYGLGAGSELLFPTANAKYEGGNHLEPAAAGAFGLDIPTGLRWDSDPVGFRLEASDHVTRSPLKPMTGSDFSPVHNFRVVLGVYAGVGTLR